MSTYRVLRLLQEHCMLNPDGWDILPVIGNKTSQHTVTQASPSRLLFNPIFSGLRLLDLKLYRTANENRVTISEVLDFTRSTHASDPRDKVYSILGLVDPPCSIQPSYETGISASQVYTAAARTIKEQCGTLDCLAFGAEVSRNTNLRLPSWVTDFSTVTDPPSPPLPGQLKANSIPAFDHPSNSRYQPKFVKHPNGAPDGA